MNPNRSTSYSVYISEESGMPNLTIKGPCVFVTPHGFRAGQFWVQMPGLLLTTCVILGWMSLPYALVFSP